MANAVGAASRGSEILTFLIADVRGYTAFTQERGDEAAAELAATFAAIMREGVEAWSGSVLELRGDEALAVFASARQALRAAVELQQVLADEVEIDPSTPLRVGIGLDAGEGVPVDGGYRGGALNLAARLCSQAQAGEVLASDGVLHLARAVEGLRYDDRGTVELKGLAEPVRVRLVVADGDAPRVPVGLTRRPGRADLPAALATRTPMLGREAEGRQMHWAWRRARRGQARVVQLVGPEGIGKTRLAADAASLAAADGAGVLYGSCLGVTYGIADVLAAASAANGPCVLVLDDLEGADPGELESLDSLLAQQAQLLVLCAYRDGEAAHELETILARTDAVTLQLGPVDGDAVRGIAALYVDADRIPLARIVEESGGVPARVHRVVSEWAQEEASRTLGEAASRAAEHRTGLRAVEAELAGNVLGLQEVQERARIYAERRREEAEDCPFKGLASFDVADTALFFGRERLVAELVSRLAGTTVLGVVGPSGSGKSSVVRAGLVPALAAGVLPGSEHWVIAVLRPGRHPTRELDRAVFAALPAQSRDRLSADEESVLDALPDGSRLAIVVDQLEEMFTLASAEERAEFVEGLIELAADPAGRAVVVLALRADFYGHCAEYPKLAELLGSNSVLVGGMTPDEYRRAIELPATRAGLRVDPALVDALVADVADEPGGLPLLSTALVEQWQLREGRTLTVEAYRKTGGVRGAVGRLAEQAFGELSPSEQDAARAVMLRLAAGEGDAVVRRRVPLSEFDTAETPDVGRVLDVFTRDRLLTAAEGTVEVAHEALFREWPRFAAWLEEDREGRRLREHLTEQAREWAERGGDAGDLYRGARLAAALDWTGEHALELNVLERDFLAQSRSAAEREADRQRRTNRRLRSLLVGAAVLLALAVVAGAVALVARGNAKHSALSATAQRLGAQALLAKDIDLSLLLARQGVALDGSQETLASLQSALVRSPQAIGVSRPLPGRLLAVDASPDGRWVAYANNSSQIAYADARSGRVVRTVAADGGSFPPARDQAIVALGQPDGSISLSRLNLRTGAEKQYGTIRKGPDDFFNVTDDGRTWALRPASSTGATVRDVKTGRVLHDIHPAKGAPPFFDVNFRGPYLVVTSLTGPPSGPSTPARVDIWRVKPWRHVATLDDPRGNWPFAVDRAGRHYAAGHADGSVTVFDLERGTSRDLHGRHNSTVQSIGFSRDGRTIVSTGDDAQVLVWDAASGELRQTLTGHNGRVFGPAFSPDGKTVYTGGLDGAAIAWDIDGSRQLGRPFRASSGNQPPDDDPLNGPGRFALSPDGRLVATTQLDGRTSVVALSGAARPALTPAARGGRVSGIAWHPDGKSFATAGEGGVETWRADGGSRLRTYRGPTARAIAVAFSPDGKLLAASTDDGDHHVYVWETSSGRLVSRDFTPKSTAMGLAFSPDGTKLAAAAGEGIASVWRLSDRELLYTANIDDGYGFGNAVAFTPNGKLLATGGGTGEVKFWNADSGKAAGRSIPAHNGWVLSIDFNPKGDVMVTAGTDGATRLWNLAKRAPFGAPLPGLDNRAANARFTQTGDRVVVVYPDDGKGFVWPMAPSTWRSRACAVAGRALTRREWELYLPGRKYDPACKSE